MRWVDFGELSFRTLVKPFSLAAASRAATTPRAEPRSGLQAGNRGERAGQHRLTSVGPRLERWDLELTGWNL